MVQTKLVSLGQRTLAEFENDINESLAKIQNDGHEVTNVQLVMNSFGYAAMITYNTKKK